MISNRYALVALFIIFFSSCSSKYSPPPPELSIPNLESAFEKCASSKAGREYISSTSQTFLKAANLDSCILKGDPTHAPISIYFDVNSMGKIGSIDIIPNSLLTYCIKQNVAKLSLPPPPQKACIVRISLTFESQEPAEENEEL